MRLSPETCRVKPLRRIKTQLLHLVGLISLRVIQVAGSFVGESTKYCVAVLTYVPRSLMYKKWCILKDVSRSCAEGFVGKPGGKKQLGRPKHVWEENNKMDL